jgi:hypothetical protein
MLAKKFYKKIAILKILKPYSKKYFAKTCFFLLFGIFIVAI